MERKQIQAPIAAKARGASEFAYGELKLPPVKDALKKYYLKTAEETKKHSAPSEGMSRNHDGKKPRALTEVKYKANNLEEVDEVKV